MAMRRWAWELEVARVVDGEAVGVAWTSSGTAAPRLWLIGAVVLAVVSIAGAWLLLAVSQSEITQVIGCYFGDFPEPESPPPSAPDSTRLVLPPRR